MAGSGAKEMKIAIEGLGKQWNGVRKERKREGEKFCIHHIYWLYMWSINFNP